MATQHLTPEAVKNSRTALAAIEADAVSVVRAASIANGLVENGIVAASDVLGFESKMPSSHVVVLLTKDQAEDIIYAVSEAHLRAERLLSSFCEVVERALE